MNFCKSSRNEQMNLEVQNSVFNFVKLQLDFESSVYGVRTQFFYQELDYLNIMGPRNVIKLSMIRSQMAIGIHATKCNSLFN